MRLRRDPIGATIQAWQPAAVAGGSGSLAAAVVFALLDLGTRQAAPPPTVRDETCPEPVTLTCPAPPACPEPALCPEAYCEACPTCPAAAVGLLDVLRRALRALAEWDDGSLWTVSLALGAAAWSLFRGRSPGPRAPGVAMDRLRAYPG